MRKALRVPTRSATTKNSHINKKNQVINPKIPTPMEISVVKIAIISVCPYLCFSSAER